MAGNASIFAADNGHCTEIYGLSLYVFGNGKKKTNEDGQNQCHCSSRHCERGCFGCLLRSVGQHG